MIAHTTIDEEVFAEGLEELRSGTKKAFAEFEAYVRNLETSIHEHEKTNTLFRSMHNLKAVTMLFNLSGMYGYFSQVEDALFKIREQRLVYEPKMQGWFESALAQLEAFYILIQECTDFQELSSQSYALPQLQEQDITSNPVRLAQITVLYAEDDPGIQLPLAKFLRRRVKELVLASDGADALEKYKIHKPDIVISDINMPFMHGLKLAEEVRKINPSIPFIITSAHNEKPFHYQAGILGITSYLVKPFDFEDLELEMVYAFV